MSMKTSEWRPVPGYEGAYDVSSSGKIRNHKTGKVMRNPIHKSGYAQAFLRKDGSQWNVYVHRLVALAFIPNSEGKPDINHIDGNKQNNSVDNLEWVTRSENTMHRYYVLGQRIKKVHAANLATGEVREYASTRAAGRDGFHQGHVAANCRGETPHHKGWKFSYV